MIAMGLVLALATAYEMALFSTRVEHLRCISQAGDRRATMVLSYLRRPSRIISALQIAATVCNTAIGMLVPFTLTPQLEAWQRRLAIPEPEDGQLASLGALLIASLVLLIFTNLVPKRVAYAYANEFSIAFARPAWILHAGLGPVADFFARMGDGLISALRVPLPKSAAISEAEVEFLLRQGERRGTISAEESDLVTNVFRLSDRKVAEIMTPRDQVQWIDLGVPAEQLRAKVLAAGRSVLPVGKKLDECIDCIRAVDLLARSPDSYSEFLIPLLRVPPGLSFLGLLDAFRDSTARMALVCDEHGRVRGMVTLNDLVRAVIGHLPAIS